MTITGLAYGLSALVGVGIIVLGQTLILVTHNPDLAAQCGPGQGDRRRPGGQRRRYRGAARRAIPAVRTARLGRAVRTARAGQS